MKKIRENENVPKDTEKNLKTNYIKVLMMEMEIRLFVCV
jgi:hypothetical protein